MSLQARCPQRIASIHAQRVLWQRRGVRCYASNAANYPDWFQQVRTELLSRKPHRHHEDLDAGHYEQLEIALIGFQPKSDYRRPGTKHQQSAPLFDLLTRFNVQVRSAILLPDGTDPLHSPGEPWSRRLWAGGAVRINPNLKLRAETPFRLLQKASCVERIKDVRLQGNDDEAKVTVTVERRYDLDGRLTDASRNQVEDKTQVHSVPEEATNDEWSNALIKEERNLVFLKAKTAAELDVIQAGQLLVPRYLKGTNIALEPMRRLLTCFSTCRTRLFPHSHSNSNPSFPILRSYIQRPSPAPRHFICPRY